MNYSGKKESLFFQGWGAWPDDQSQSEYWSEFQLLLYQTAQLLRHPTKTKFKQCHKEHSCGCSWAYTTITTTCVGNYHVTRRHDNRKYTREMCPYRRRNFRWQAICTMCIVGYSLKYQVNSKPWIYFIILIAFSFVLSTIQYRCHHRVLSSEGFDPFRDSLVHQQEHVSFWWILE